MPSGAAVKPNESRAEGAGPIVKASAPLAANKRPKSGTKRDSSPIVDSSRLAPSIIAECNSESVANLTRPRNRRKNPGFGNLKKSNRQPTKLVVVRLVLL